MFRLRLACLLLPLAAATAHAEERILDYHGDIRLAADGGLTVTETIRVRAEGDQIRRGIYRDFPTRYRDRNGRRVRVPLEVVSVERGGEPEAWHTESTGNGKRVYFGSADVYLDPGVYTYDFTYRTDRQVGFFEDYDELYWNVTGNHWAFPIVNASATVRLPEPVPRDRLRLAAYTGPEGASGNDYRARVPEPGRVDFETTAPLGPREGLTVAVGFPKGVVAEPSAARKRWWFIRDNLGLIAGFVGLLAALAWYFVAWHRAGRDPAGGVIYPRYEPPAGYSPASLRYVWRMGFDKTCFAAGLVSLAARGALSLDKSGGDYVATKLGDDPRTESKTELKLFRRLFGAGDRLRFERDNHSRISSVIKAHESALSNAYEGRYFKRNRVWLVPGALLSLGGTLLMLILVPGEEKFVGLFLLAWLSVWTFGAAGLALAALRAWRDLHGVVDFGKAVLTSLFAVPFVAAELAVIGAFGYLVGLLPMLIVGAFVAVNLLFYQLLKAPTPDGRKLLDEIEGLRLYLGVAERQDLEARHGDEPPKTLERFESLLPYAVALDAADTWAEKFEAEIREAERSGELRSRGWYSAATGGSRGFSASGLSSGLSSDLTNAVASAATAPGSSSGSGGGGFSGGGGGGGGGGGW